MKSDKLKKRLRWLLTLICVGYVIYFLIKNHHDLKLIFDLDPVALCILFFLSCLSQLLVAFRLRIVIHKCSGIRLMFRQWFKVFILGRFLNLIFPQSGNIYRSVRLKKDYGISYTDYISTITSYFWMDTCLNLMFALLVVCLVDTGLKLGQFSAVSFLILLICVIAICPIALELIFSNTHLKNRYANRVHKKIHEILITTLNNLRDIRYIAKIFSTAVIAFCYYITALYFCFSVFMIKIPLPALALFHVIMRLSNTVTITPGNIGLRELAYGIVSSQMGVGLVEGVVISIVMRIIGTLVLFVFGLMYGGIGLLRDRNEYRVSPKIVN